MLITGIYDLTKFSTLDYPNHLAAIIWFAGCNMKCDYCYNPNIVYGKGYLTEQEIFSFLEQRKDKLEGVVLSGGECSLYPNIKNLCFKIKQMGFKIKIDTNGTNPKIIKNLVKENLIDFISLDYKAPKEKFFFITKNKKFEVFEETLKFLIKKNFQFEVRTTVHSSLLNEEDIYLIIKDLENKDYKNVYYIQNFLESETIKNIKNDHIKFKLKTNCNISVEYRNY